MVMLVTLEEAKIHVRADGDDDSDLTIKIHAASGAVINYLKRPAFIGADGLVDESAVPYEVKAATLLMVGYFYKDRDNDENEEYQTGYLPRPVTALLYPLRDPALA